MFSATSSQRTDLASGRVRNVTSSRTNQRIDKKTEKNIEHYKKQDQSEIARRIRALDKEWDIERVIELHASALALTGLVLGVVRNRKWLAIPAIILPSLLLHSVHGWYPPLPVFRALGIRTRNEINQEKMALLESGS